ncbi:hypothetical protein [Solitalea canadensis]|uniref:Uncharacterized protein n=1 Tax=Solitalea canadensis (strain ATCC 29591 / DSM 3403 / JCM 21819 / LMG 8368 / NBRC 15130 / NCIMB 12057 / USAM 9D) TaxID=929556 RepID=H8KLG4_SOLCM|nr:hypothetical protein [Solitalea canadensis]AFD08851.1 hypothetical protein Solca_3854 [Solitalea canadensis DSM 3403]
MKKLLLLLGAGILFVSCSKLDETKPDETTLPVEKRLKFNIYAGTDYSDAKYDATTALIKLQAINKKRATGVEQILWETTVEERQIKLYPLANKPIVVEKSITNVIDKDDEIRYYYKVTYKYNNGATTSNSEKSEVFENGNMAKQLGISL